MAQRNSKNVAITQSNRRMRTRMSGGVGGEEPQGSSPIPINPTCSLEGYWAIQGKNTSRRVISTEPSWGWTGRLWPLLLAVDTLGFSAK
jgi:hypothetical protein